MPVINSDNFCMYCLQPRQIQNLAVVVQLLELEALVIEMMTLIIVALVHLVPALVVVVLVNVTTLILGLVGLVHLVVQKNLGTAAVLDLEMMALDRNEVFVILFNIQISVMNIAYDARQY